MAAQFLLRDIANIRVGFTLRGRDASRRQAGERGAHLLRISDLTPDGRLEVRSEQQVQATDDRIFRYGVEPGDIVIANRGARMTAALVPPALSALAGGQLFVIRPDARRVSPGFLCRFLNLKATQERLAAMAKGSYVKGLSKAALATLEVPVLPMAKQSLLLELAELSARERELAARIAALRERFLEGALEKLIASQANS